MTSILLVTLPVCDRAAENPPVARVALERLAGDPTRGDQQPLQFLAADAKGRVFLLHGDTLEVDQILSSGKIAAWRMPRANAASDAAVTDAAMPPAHEASNAAATDATLSPDGSSWLVASGPDELILLSGDDRRQLPTPHWWVSALAYTADGPVVAVLPAWAGGEDATGRIEWDKPPSLLRFDDEKWQALGVQEPPTLEHADAFSFEQMKSEGDTRLAAGRKGVLWAAQHNAYLLKRYARSGAVEESVAVDGGHVQWKQRTEDDRKALEKAAQAAGLTLATPSRRLQTVAVRVVRGLTAQDDRVYLVVETPEGIALDRWDDETQVLDRLLLAGIEPGRSSLSLAAGRDGLYIAGRGLGQPVWRVDWQRLEDAKWKAVTGVVAQRPRKQ